MRRSPRRSLVGGEIDPDLWYASDLTPVRPGAAEVVNFIVRPQGGVERTPGTEFVARARGVEISKLAAFVRSSAEAYLVEYANFTLRVRDVNAGHAIAADLNGPWQWTELRDIQTAQSNDVQWHVTEFQRPRELRRISDGAGGYAFELADAAIRRGPFREMNQDEARTIKASAATGSVTLTANFDFFAAAHVSTPMRFEEGDYSSAPSWGPGEDVVAGAAVRWNGHVYEAATGGRTTGQAPTHRRGELADGPAATAVVWRYLHSGFGIATIDAVSGPRSATATVESRLPGGVVSDATWLWQEGAWSEASGWPRSVALYKSALWFGGTPTDPNVLWKSAIEGFDDFEPGTDEDASLSRGLYGGGTEAIRWLAPGAALAIGTDGPEWMARPEQERDTVRTNNLLTDIATNEGASPVPGRTIGPSTIFIDVTRRSLKALSYDFRSDNWVASDLTIFAKHILGAGAVEMVYQRKPYPIVWCLLVDGTLAGLTYLPNQDVLAWHRAEFGGAVRSITVVPTHEGTTESLYLAVDRIVAGQPEIHIERMAQPWSRAGLAVDHACFLHAGKVGVPTGAPRVYGGLDHLEGRSVVALVDGMMHPAVTVEGGQVTLNFDGDRVFVGLRYRSRFKSLPFDTGAIDDFQAGKMKRISDLFLGFRDTLGGSVFIDGREQRVFPLGDTALDSGPGLHTGMSSVLPPGAGDGAGQFTYETDTVWPATITAAFLEYGV